MSEIFEMYEETRYYQLACVVDTPVEVLSKIMKISKDGSTIAKVARHRNTTQEMLLALTRSSYELVRREIAERANLTNEMMDILIKDNMTVRFYLARNPNTPIQYQLTLAQDETWRVREQVATTSKFSEVQRLLTRDTNYHVLVSLVSNPHLDKELFDEIYSLQVSIPSENSATIRFNLVANHQAPKELLEKAKSDPNPDVSNRARSMMLRDYH